MSDLTPPPDENPFGSPTPQPGSTPVPPPPPAYGSVPPPPPPPPTYGATTPPQVPPTYGAPGYGAPAYGQGYAKPQNGPGTTALVTGIISLFCCGFILGVVAIVQGRKGMALADQGLATNRGAAQAGFVLGIVGIVLWVAWLAYLVSSGNFSSSFKVGT